MLIKTGLPKTLLWVINLLLIYIFLFTAFRLALIIAFKPEEVAWSNIVPSLLLGLRFDLRWISLLLLPIVIISLYPTFSPFYSARNQKWWTGYLALVTFIVVFFFAADFGCFSYNKTRLNASALNFAEDPGISAAMMWESYPVFWLLLLLFLAVLGLRWIFRQTHVYVITKTDGHGIQYQRKWFLLASLLFGFLVYGSLSSQPLRWNNAFILQDSFRSYMALNPLQNFFTTLRFRKPQASPNAAERHFSEMKDWLQLPSNQTTYSRTSIPAKVGAKPNVVLVLCESFSMYKSSMSGNPLNTTPYFDSLRKEGVFFSRCFSPHFSTARGLFATITGIPDVQLSKFSTRNQEALNQRTIINDFAGYKKMYFLGGDPSFNNFAGLLQNVKGLEMITEGRFKSKPINVWGISDKDLFLEANEHFVRQTEPFFAIVQTADNHRPFMIPEGEKVFQKKNVPIDSLKKYGFETVDEYNSFRYADYCFQVFMEAAKKEKYFENTVFVFVGDHGVSGNAKAVYGDVWTKERLTDEHVPLLFYGPKWVTAEQRTDVVSQIDVLPTVASITGQTFTNTTLGRNVLKNEKGNHFAFIIHHDEGRIGMVTDEFYFTKNLNFLKEDLHFIGRKKFSTAQQDSIKK
ncbi:MAG TPA: sulfatase-like hydrolase/transferase, partial [Flavisolibacter sp.]|nr:sulfatase-like hydrolase/transferase [Flavisolibacter sp.]